MRSALKSLFSGAEREAWIRFLIALGGLALAFGAAIASTLARQAGNAFATVLLASVSLVIALLVALATVPYLARRVALSHMRDAIDYDVTREGVAYLVLTLVIGIAALNTGNNMLFIVVSAMLGAVLVSGIASAAVLRALELDVMLPAHAFAGQSVQARLALRNRRRLLASFSVSVVPPHPPKSGKRLRFRRTVFAIPANRPLEQQWLRLPDLAFRLEAPPPEPAPIFTGSVYFPYVPPRTTVTGDVNLNFTRRGRYEQDTFGLATRFPFSFLLKTRRVKLARELIVFPSVQPADESLEVLPMITGEFESFVRGRGFNLYRIREYMPEDSARHVDWKATAKSGSLKVREFTREDERKLRIVFDNPAPGAVSEPDYETAVSLAASLAWHFAAENTELSFAACGYSGSPDLYDFLTYLALVQLEPGASVLDDLQVTDDYNLIVTWRPRGSIPTSLWNSSYLVFIGESSSK